MERGIFYAYMHPDDRRAVSTPQRVQFFMILMVFRSVKVHTAFDA
jgi:hypothetical protein